MSKQHGDFVIYVRDGVEINALVVFSRTAAPAVQSNLPRALRPAAGDAAPVPVEHLTLVYLKPASASLVPTGDQIRDSIVVQFDVLPLGAGVVNGWKEIVDVDGEEERIEGSPRDAGDPEAYARLLYTKSKQIQELEAIALAAASAKDAQDVMVEALKAKVAELMVAAQETQAKHDAEKAELAAAVAESAAVTAKVPEGGADAETAAAMGTAAGAVAGQTAGEATQGTAEGATGSTTITKAAAATE